MRFKHNFLLILFSNIPIVFSVTQSYHKPSGYKYSDVFLYYLILIVIICIGVIITLIYNLINQLLRIRSSNNLNMNDDINYHPNSIIYTCKLYIYYIKCKKQNKIIHYDNTKVDKSNNFQNLIV